MTYAYNSKIYLAEAVLNVKDLARQTAFYTQILGLEVLSQTEGDVLLGAGGKPLVHLIQTDRSFHDFWDILLILLFIFEQISYFR